MREFVDIVWLVTIVVAVSAVARRWSLVTPILLVVVGLALSLVPGFPAIHLDPEFILIGVLPPLLYVAALETSVPAFKYNLRSILLLAIGLVIFTMLAVGFVVHALLPRVPLSACLALGAVVAPPDAIATTAIARRIGLPRRMVTILEGESLLNDASALVLFRVTVAAAVGTAVGFGEITAEILHAAGGGILVGAAGAVVLSFLHRRTTDSLLDNALSLLTPFLVALAADALGASPVVAVVVTGLYLGHRWPTLLSAGSRLQMGAFWRMVKFLLEGLVFLAVGLQLREVLDKLDTEAAETVVLTLAVLGTVILARFIWVYPATYLPRLIPRIRERDPAPPLSVPTVVGWAGMRGVITLATALALPVTLAGRLYPRDLFVWLAFAVIVGTLVIQGLTLARFARWVHVPADDPTEDFLSEATIQYAASRAARERLDELAPGAPSAVVERLRELTQSRSNIAWERLGGDGAETPSAAYVRLRRAMLDAEREVFRTARDEGRIPEEVLVRAQRDMDLEEAMLERGGRE